MPNIDLKFITEILNENIYSCFVETGTYAGDTILSVEPYFEELHTIEIKREQYEASAKLYNGDKITFHLGDSSIVLKDIIPELKKPTIFFLDAHWSEGSTGKGKKDVPLLEEIKLINDLFYNKAVVIVDDFRLFGSGPKTGTNVNWEDINESYIDEILKERITKKEYKESIICKNDRIIYFIKEKII